jgi:succinyl-CoA synthetase beta subunit
MAPLLEDRIKGLLGRDGLRVPEGVTVSSGDEAVAAAARLGLPAVVKALVPTGKKGRAGAVRFVRDALSLRAAVAELVGGTFHGFRADSVLVEAKVPIARELFVSFNFDALARAPVLLMGTEGGVDVEEAVAANPGAFTRLTLDPSAPPDAGTLAKAWRRLGLSAQEAARAGEATALAEAAFRRYDARVLEINPLAIDVEGNPVVVGALLDVDDDALFRQPELAQWVEWGSGRVGRTPTELERRILQLNADEKTGSIRFMELQGGDLGCLVFGGGCSLWSTDHIIAGGGRPATYYDATTPSERMLRALFEGVLQLPGLRGLVFGSNIVNLARIDARVRVLVETLEDLRIDVARFPVVVRVAGTGEEEARRHAARIPHLDYYGDDVTLEEALDRFLERVRAAPREGVPA